MAEFKCTGCGARLEIDESASDNQIKCPDCGKVMDSPMANLPPIGFVCNNCGSELYVSVFHAGKMVNCNRCGNAVLVPALQKGGPQGRGCFALLTLLGILLLAGSTWLLS